MRKNRRESLSHRILAIILTISMLFSSAGFQALAEEAQSETPTQTEAAVQGETSAQTEAPAQKEAPAQTEAPVQKETPAQTEAPVQKETPAQTEAPAQGETPSQTEALAQGETPAQTEAPAQDETPVQTEAPTQGETPAQTEASVQDETPAQTEAPAQGKLEDQTEVQEKKETAPQEETKTPEEAYQTEFSFQTSSFGVQVVLSDSKAMSAQAEFRAEEKSDATDYFGNAYGLVQTWLESRGMTALDGTVYDMGFYKDGVVVEPASGTAKITVQYVNGLDLQISDFPGAFVKVFHIGTDEATGRQYVSDVTRSAVLNSDGTVRSVGFVLDQFSPVVVAGVIDLSALETAEEEEQQALVLYENESTPVNLNAYIKTVTVEYYDETNQAWTEYTAGTELSGNAKVRLNAEFAGLPWEELKKHGYQASTTYSMPGFADFSADSDILGPDSKPCGRLHAAEGTVLLTFDPDYFKNDDSGKIMGTFQLEAEADWKKIPGDSIVKVQVGDVEKSLVFEDNLTAKYSDVTVDKQAGSIRPAKDGEEDGYYIDYTVTLTVTGNKTVPAVTVRDEFDSIQVAVKNESGQTVYRDGAPKYVEASLAASEITEYAEGTSPDSPNPVPVPAVQTDKNGKSYLFWDLGDVALTDDPAETSSRIFRMTYTAKLSDDYVNGGYSRPITNVATPAANGVEKTPDQETVGAKANLTLKKEIINDSANASSLYYKNYVITVTAPADNTYTLPSVVIRDTVDAGAGGNPYISYADGLYTKVNQSTNLLEKDESKYNFYLEKENSDGSFSAESYETEKLVKDGRSFSLDIGALKPGETKKITYTVKIDEGAYSDSKNDATNGGQLGYTKVTLNNTAYVDRQVLPGMGEKKASAKTDSLEKSWLRKMEGGRVAAGTKCFAGTDHEFTAAANTFEYHLLVNEEADMAMASPSITDSIGVKMKFAGYARIERYTREQLEAFLSDFPNTQGSNLVSAMENLRAAQTPAVTWKKIDGTSFTVSLPENTKDCYYITYYAVVDDTSFAGTVTSVNSASLGGISGSGSGANFKTEVKLQTQISGSMQLSVDKEYWYHTGPDYSDGSRSGDIYWKVKVNGTVPEGYTLQDTYSGYSVELVGIYKEQISQAETAEDLAGLAQMPEEDYTTTETKGSNNSYTRKIKFLKEFNSTEADPVYVVFKTHYVYNGKASDDTMWGGQNYSTYKNSVSMIDTEGKSVAEDKDVPATILVKDKRITKACLCVFYYDGKTNPDMKQPLWKKEKEANGGKYEPDLIQNIVNKAIQNGQITERGYYLIWNIKVNHMSDMEGDVQITENLPDGLNFRFVDFYWASDNYKNKHYSVPSISTTAVPGTTGTIQMEVNGLKANDVPKFNTYAAEFSVCTQIDDAQLRTEGSKTYENSATLNYKGCTYTTDSSMDISLETLSKEMLSDTPSAQGTYSFRLAVNPDGIDWHSDTGKMELYDELSVPLELLTDTITVTNTATKAVLEKGSGDGQWNVSYDSEKNGVVTWKFVLPDDQPLEIVYQTRVSALPNSGIIVSNKAHWEATQTTDSSTVEKTLKYSATATAKLENPQLIVTKKDAEKTDLKLSGAKFTLQPVTRTVNTDGTVSWADAGTAITRTTDNDGVASFSGSSLVYDQVYRLSETEAPAGYDKDENTYLLVFSLTTDAAAIAQWQKDGVLVNQSYYNKEVFNRKKRGSLAIAKSVTGNTAPSGASYTISVSRAETDLSGVKAVNDKGEEVALGGGKLAGDVTFSFRAGETVTLSGLPYGEYVIREFRGTEDKFAVSYVVEGDSESTDPVSVTVGDSTPSVTVKNAYPYEERIVLKGSKSIRGDMPSDKTFTFVLNGTGMAQADTKTLTTPIADTADSFTFDELVFHSENLITGDNVYRYTVKEQHPDGASEVKDANGKIIGYRSAGIVYDATVYNVKITITKAADSSLTKKVEVKKSTESEGKYREITADSEDGSYALTGGAAFANTYSEVGSAELKVRKQFAGTFPEDGFTFQVTPANETAQKLAASFSNLDENGQITVTGTDKVSVGTLQFTENGTYEYSISEVIPNAAKNNHNVSGNIRYDSTGYDVRITVADGAAKDGNKTVTVSAKKAEETAYTPVTSGIYTAEFVNDQVGSLTVSKQVSADGDTDKTFTFTVALKNSDNTPYTGKVRVDGREQTVTGGTISFGLKHGEEKVISEIPYGIQYEVRETADADYTSSVSGNHAVGTIGETTPDVTAAYTNTRKKGSLTITKKVVGVYTPDADSYEDTFYFTVQDKDGYYYNAEGEKQTKTLNGSAVLVMNYRADDSSANSLTVTGLLSGETYKVTEVEKTGDDNYAPAGNAYPYTVSYDSSTTATPAKEQEAAISSTPAAVEVTNTLKEGSAYFTKQDSVSGALLYGAAFKLEETTGTDTAREILTFTTGKENGVPAIASVRYAAKFAASDVSVSIDADGKVTISGLHYGAYVLTETAAPADYVTPDAGIVFTIDSTAAKAVGTNGVVTNDRQTGEIEVSKRVVGDDNAGAFTFTFEFKDPYAGVAGYQADYRTTYHGKAADAITFETKDAIVTGTATLANGESVKISGIPVGTAYTVTETENTDYATTVGVNQGAVLAGTVAGGTDYDQILTELTSVAFTNTKRSGLTITKNNIGGVQADSFTVLLETKVNGEWTPYSGAYSIGETAGSTSNGKISMTGGQTVSVSGLPVGTEYRFKELLPGGSPYTETYRYGTATEAAELADGYVQGSILAEGESWTIDNTYRTGSVSFKKVDSKDAGRLVGASFTLQKKDAKADGGYTDYVSFAIVKKANGTGYEVKDVTAEDSVTCTMAEDGTVTIRGLFWDTYRLVETAAESGYVSAHTDGTDFIWASEDIVINETAPNMLANDLGNITNDRQTKDLTVTKAVTGTNGDKEAAYTFLVSIQDGYAGKNADGTNYSYDWYIGTEKKGSVEANAQGQTITLSDGQTAVIRGLPLGAVYTVTEQNVPADMQAKVTAVSGGAAVLARTEVGASGEIADTDAAVTFTNTKLEDITLTKNQVGGSIEDAFTFILDLKDTPENVNYDVVYTDAAGRTASAESGSADKVTRGNNNTIILKDGMTAKIEKLPYGTQYEITEQKAEDSLYTTTINKGKVEQTSTGTLTVGTADATVFTNTHAVKDLVLSKTVAEGDRTKLFTFTLNLDTLGDISEYIVEYRKDGQTVADTDIPEGSAVTVHAGKNTIKLSHSMTATVKGLEVGTGYTVTEDPGTDYDVSAKVNGSDAALSNNGVSGKVISNQENAVAFTNTKRTKDVAFSKKAATGMEELPGAELAVYKASDVTTTAGVTTAREEAAPVASWTSGETAHEVKGVLEYEGHYVLIETGAPVGYAFADPIFFHIDVNGKVFIDTVEQKDAVITMRDRPLHFSVNKTDLTGEREVRGATLEVYETDEAGKASGDAVASWSSDGSVHDFGSELEAGKSYVLKEISAPTGYAYSEEIRFAVAEDGTVTSEALEDGVILVKDAGLEVKVSKTDLTGEREVRGATLEVYETDEAGKASGDAVASWSSDGSVHDFGSELEAGKNYVLKETSAPTGYAYSEEIRFAVAEDGTVTSEALEDGVILVKDAGLEVKVSKTDLTGEREVRGATLEVYETDESGKASGDAVASWSSDGSVHDFGSELEAGKSYVLKEISAPTGYAYSEEIRFAVAKDGTVTSEALEDEVIPVKDAPLHFEVNKVDLESGEEVEGAELTVYGPQGEKVDSWTSKKGETHDFGSKLEAGKTYTLKETIAPDGYAYVSEIVFTVKEDGSIETEAPYTTDEEGNVTYLVQDQKTSVKISKVDILDGNELEGAHIQILDRDGRVVAEWNSEKKAHEVEGLKTGETYTLRETVAPKGYEITADTVFALDAYGSIDRSKTTTTISEEGVLLVEDTMTPSVNASLSVTKELTYDGIGVAAADETFYVALFVDEECTKRVSDVKAIEFKNSFASTVTFTGLDIGRTYYVAEVNAEGTFSPVGIVSDGTFFEAAFKDGYYEKVVAKDGTTSVYFENRFENFPVGFYKQAELTITKKLVGTDGKPMNSDKVFYAGIFSDAGYTTLADIVEKNIVELNLAGGSQVSEMIRVMVNDGETAVLYVTEVDENGIPVEGTDGFMYEVTMDKNIVALSTDNRTASVTITNQEKEETEEETEIETEIMTETEKTDKKTSVKTGDDTPLAPMTTLLMISGLAVLAMIYRRRRYGRLE